MESKVFGQHQWVSLVLKSGLAILLITTFLTLAACTPVKTQAVTSPVSNEQQIQQRIRSCPSCSAIVKPTYALSNVRSQTADGRILLLFYLILDASSSDTSSEQMVMQAYGRSTLLGMMEVREASPAQMCGAPVGTYRIYPLTPSYITSGVISGGTFEALGPTRILFHLSSSSFTFSGRHRLNLNAVIDSVNDTSCSDNLVSQ